MSLSTFPGIIKKNANRKHISLTGTDHFNSKLSKNIQFENDIHILTFTSIKIQTNAVNENFQWTSNPIFL